LGSSSSGGGGGGESAAGDSRGSSTFTTIPSSYLNKNIKKSGSFYYDAKIVRKTLTSTIL
jgi:hypothetical protein